MPDTIFLRVCVLAPLFDELALLPDALKTLLAGCVAVHDTKARGQVYGDARDDWKPFAGGKSVAEYVSDGGFQLNSLSSQLLVSIETETLQTLLRDVDLYVIDPLFLGLGDFKDTIRQIEAAISGDPWDDKRCAVLIPEHLPADLQAEMNRLADKGLKLLYSAYRKQGKDHLWRGENPDRLENYLRRLLNTMKNRPWSGNVEGFDRLAALLGARANFDRPILVGGR